MKRRSRDLWARLGLVLLFLLFVGVSQRLFSSRYWAGDVHPPYSTLDSSPEGARALFEALAALPGREVKRNHQPLHRLDQEWTAPAGTTLVFVGWPSSQLTGGEEVPEELDRLASAGARIVLALAPTPLEDQLALSLEEILDEAEDGESEPDEPPGEERPEPVEKSAEESTEAAARGARWAFEVFESDQAAPVALRTPEARSGGLREEIAWRAPLRLELLDETWQALYTVDGEPVLAERPFGPAGGSVVLAAGSFFLTNQALSEERHPELLARVLGPASRVVFDESHLGLVSTPGVVALGKRYRLHGVALALAAVLGLAVWRGTTSLMPAPAAEAPHPIAARGSREGLVALLGRGIPANRLLAVCLEQWSAASTRNQAGEEAHRISREADPVNGYRRLSELLEPRKRSR